MTPSVALALALVVASGAAALRAPASPGASDFETYSVVCTEAADLPRNRIAGMDSAATCTVRAGHVTGATAVARIARTMNATGWDDYRSYVVDRSGGLHVSLMMGGGGGGREVALPAVVVTA